MSAATLSLLIAGESHFGVPVISGTPGIIGGVLSCTVSASYQWKRDGASIGGATSQTYTQDKNDIGPALTCVTPAGTSNTLRYLPTQEGATVLDWFDPAPLTPGLIATWAGVKALITLTAAGGARPTASATSINGTPGVTGDGAANIMSGALDLSTRSTVRIVFAGIDTATALSLAMEHTASVAVNNGSFAVVPNSTNAGDIGCYARGTVAFGYSDSGGATAPMTAATVLSICPDTSIADGTGFGRNNGTALTMSSRSGLCQAGNFANSTLNVFARSGALFPWSGTLGAWAILSGNAQDALLDRVERFCAYRAAIAVW